MRIISGKLKGRRLVSFKAEHIRPTTDRVKEVLFNILQGDLPGARVCDLFSGTGNLAIEAYSRGAGYVEAVESHKTSLQIIADNLRELKLSKEIHVVKKDVYSYLEGYSGEPFDLVFIDPPFTERMAHPVLEAVAKSEVCREGGVVIIEASKHERVDDNYGVYKLLDRRDFGDKSAFIFRRG
jgi:16S rRNA (guanine966-N2)-methyltransferase